MKPNTKMYITVGLSAGAAYLVGDTVADQFATGEDGNDIENADLYRGGGLLVAGGLLGTMLARKNKAVGIGIGAGLAAAGVRRIAHHYEWDTKLRDAIEGEDNSSSGRLYATDRRGELPAPEADTIRVRVMPRAAARRY